MVYRHGQVSRSDLHELTGVRLNSIGEQTAELLERGVLRECDVQVQGRGRPRVPLMKSKGTFYFIDALTRL